MPEYRKKPLTIEAHRITVFNLDWIEEWCGGRMLHPKAAAAYRQIAIDTPEGVMLASVGDWVIRGVAGEFYPCKHEVFEQTYEAA